MKQFYTVLFLTVAALTATAQNITFTDAALKTWLTQANCAGLTDFGPLTKADTNNDGEIQFSEALAVKRLGFPFTTATNGFPLITDIASLQHFSNLKFLGIDHHALSSITLNLPLIEELSASNNNISVFNPLGFPNLKVLSLNQNMIQALDVSGLSNLEHLSCSQNSVLTTVNASGLLNLEYIYCDSSAIQSLNVTGSINLLSILCQYNQISSLDLTGLSQLIGINCRNNQLTSINLTGCSGLMDIICMENQLTTLDFSDCMLLKGFMASSNNLETVIMKNGAVSGTSNIIMLQNNPNLKYICADEQEIVHMLNIIEPLYPEIVINTYCTFTPGSQHNTITGKLRFDGNFNGCDGNDEILQNVKVSLLQNTTTLGTTYTNSQGEFTFYSGTGNFTVTTQFNSPLFNVTPNPATFNLATVNNTITSNFCITPNGVQPDLDVTLLPIFDARPGFDATYKLILRNKGNQVQSGIVNLQFNDEVLDYVSSSAVPSVQTANSLTWTFTDLSPFNSMEISLKLNVNSPLETPAVNIDDILPFTASITTAQTDITPTDNSYQFNQVVIDSYDPNDKQVVQGATITPAQATGYLDYIIRFQNSGTAEAINVVVKDMLAANLDPTTFVPIAASHPYRAVLSATNKLEFIFEGINLPAQQDNEPASHGFIAFKIKPKNTVNVGSVLLNTAEIYFDYNAPIITNTVSTTVAVLLAVDFQFNNHFSVYPNPAKETITIAKKGDMAVTSISIYNMLGQLVLAIPNSVQGDSIPVNIASLKQGNYIIEIKTDKGRTASKFIKN